MSRPRELDGRGRRLRAALAAVLVRDNAPELRLVRAWLDNWSGIGLIVVGMSAFHLAIAVRDLEKSRAFYQRLFAMTPTLETDEVVLLTTPARREQLALQRKPSVTVDADTWNHRGVHFGFVVSEEVLGHSGEAIRQAGGEVVAEGSRAMGPYLFSRDPDGYLVELFVDRGWRA